MPAVLPGTFPLELPRLFAEGVEVRAIRFGLELAETTAMLPESLRTAVPKRKAEFVAGRWCAREALRAAGAGEVEDIPIGAQRAPVWPAGFVGSITHSHGMAAAAVARVGDARGLGLDLEPFVEVTRAARLAPKVARPEELALAAAIGLEPGACFTLVFAAKEALFKCVAPIVGRYFDFLDARVTAVASDAISFELAADLGSGFDRGRSFNARWARVDEGIVAAVHI